MDFRQPQCGNFFSFVGHCGTLAVLLLCHRWLVSLSWIYSTGRSNYQQNLYDARGRRKHKIAALFSSPASKDVMLFQIRSHAEALNSIATALPEIWRCARPVLNHIPIQQRQIFLCIRITGKALFLMGQLHYAASSIVVLLLANPDGLWLNLP